MRRQFWVLSTRRLAPSPSFACYSTTTSTTTPTTQLKESIKVIEFHLGHNQPKKAVDEFINLQQNDSLLTNLKALPLKERKHLHSQFCTLLLQATKITNDVPLAKAVCRWYVNTYEQCVGDQNSSLSILNSISSKSSQPLILKDYIQRIDTLTSENIKNETNQGDLKLESDDKKVLLAAIPSCGPDGVIGAFEAIQKKILQPEDLASSKIFSSSNLNLNLFKEYTSTTKQPSNLFVTPWIHRLSTFGIYPDIETFIHLFKIQNQSNNSNMEEIEKLWNLVETTGLTKTQDLYAQLAFAYSKIRNFEKSKKVIDEILVKFIDNISLTSIEAVNSLMEICEKPEEFFQVFKQVQTLINSRTNSQSFGIQSYTSLLKLCSTTIKISRRLWITNIDPFFWKQVSNDVLDSTNLSLRPDSHFYNTLLSLIVHSDLLKADQLLEAPFQPFKEKPQLFQEAIDLFSRMRYEGTQPSTYSYNILLNGYAKMNSPPKSRLNNALKIYNIMKDHGLQPTTETYTALFNACSASKSSKTIDQRILVIESEMRERKIPHDKISYTTFLRVLGEGKLFNDMFHSFQKINKLHIPLDVHVFNTLFSTSRHDRKAAVRALEFFSRMKNEDIQLNSQSYKLIIDCCIKAYRPELASWIFFEHRPKRNVPVNVQMLNSLLQLYFSTDQEELFQSTFQKKFKEFNATPDQSTILVALRYWGLKKKNFEKTKEVIAFMERNRIRKSFPIEKVVLRASIIANDWDIIFELLKGSPHRQKHFEHALRVCSEDKMPDARKRGEELLDFAKSFWNDDDTIFLELKKIFDK